MYYRPTVSTFYKQTKLLNFHIMYMIVSKEQLDCFDAQGKPSKKLVISYVNKDKGISFFQWNVP